MSKSAIFGELLHRFDRTNTTGVFRITFKGQQFYYFTEQSRQIQYPYPLNSAWQERVVEAAANVLRIPSTRARPSASATTAEEAECKDEEQQEPSRNKRQRIEEQQGDHPPQEEVLQQEQTIEALSYWPDSPEARKVFVQQKTRSTSGRSKDWRQSSAAAISSESAKKALERRIQLLQSIHESEDGWRRVVIGRDENNYCTKLEIVEIRQRSTSLCCTYKMALGYMNKKTWHERCKMTCKLLNSFGLWQATFFNTIANWNKVFRKMVYFPHPIPYVQCRKRALPLLLELYPDAKDQIVSFGIKNLATLTIESVHDFIIATIVPRLTLLWRSENSADATSTEDVPVIFFCMLMD